MILLDANILLYAYNPDFPRHERARAWLQAALSRPDPVRLAWVSILGFLRISTNPRAFPYPFSAEEASGVVTTWLAQPMVEVLQPGERHWEILRGLLTQSQARGASVTDAHLASLALEHGATLCSSDRDFLKFPGLRLLNPFESTSR